MDTARLLPAPVRRRYALKLFAIAALIIGVIVGFSILVGLQVSERVTEEQLDSLEANAQLEAATLDQWIDGEQPSVRQLSSHRGIDPSAPAATRETLRRELAAMPNETAHLLVAERTPGTVSMTDNQTIVASTDRSMEGRSLNETNIDWNPAVGYSFDSIDDVVLSWVYIDGEDPSVAIASPTPDGEHALVAVYRTNVRASNFTSVVDETETVVLGGFTAYVLFDDNKSNVMTPYKNDRENTTIGSLILDSDPYEHLSGSVKTGDAVKGYHSLSGEDVDWIVVKEAPRSSALALTEEVRSDLALLILLTVLGFVLVGVVIQRGPIRSIQRLAGQANAIAAGDLSVDIEDEGRVDEIGRVRSAFRNTKQYVETITRQSEALSSQDFDAPVLAAEIPGRVGESMTQMRTDLEQFIDDIERERERYTTLVEQSSDGVVVVQAGRCAFVNDRFVDITGYAREALLGTPFSRLVVPADRDLVEQRYRQRLEGESPPDRYEVGIETADDERRTVELSIARIEHEGDPAALVNVRDVTTRKRRERAVQALQDATEWMQTAETAEEVATIAVETASQALDFPHAICWMPDEAEQSLAPVAATDPVHEDGLVSALSPDRYEYAVFESGEVTRYSPAQESADNPLEAGALLPLGEHGLVAAGRRRGRIDDVTLEVAHALAEHTTTALDRVERDRAVRESEQRFRLIAERIDAVIYLATPDFSEVLYVNPAYEDVWGRPVETVYDDTGAFFGGIDARDREAVKAEFDAMLADVAADEQDERYAFEFRIRTPDNEVNWVSAQAYPVELAEGHRRIVGIADDVTDRKRREQRLEVFNRVLRHNLRNQLDVIGSHAEILADREDRHARQILSATERLGTTGRRARTIDRIMSREVQPTAVDLPALVSRTLESLDAEFDLVEADQTAPLAAGNGDPVAVRTDVPESATVRTDRWILETMLESTLENALRHGKSTVTIDVETTATDCTIEITDDGSGIPEDELATLDAGTETDLQHSSGLGLWQLKWAVETLNGDLAFEVEDGTTVRISLPSLDSGPN